MGAGVDGAAVDGGVVGGVGAVLVAVAGDRVVVGARSRADEAQPRVTPHSAAAATRATIPVRRRTAALWHQTSRVLVRLAARRRVEPFE